MESELAPAPRLWRLSKFWPRLDLLILLLCLAPCFTASQNSTGSNLTYEMRFSNTQLEALQSIRGAWKNTPEKEKNLAGWNASQRAPCDILDLRNNREPFDFNFQPWRGVECMHMFSDVTGFFYIRVSGLTLNNASIKGVLPTFIWDIYTLSSIVLTGNPSLTGPLPKPPIRSNDTESPSGWSKMLHTLDLHDNNLSGNITSGAFQSLDNLKRLDLSGNTFTGEYQTIAFDSMKNIRWLSLARNNLSGPLDSLAFNSHVLLENLDLSHNQFEGSSPNLSKNTVLRNLDISKNQFHGSLPDLSMIPTLQRVNFSGNHFSGPLNLSSVFNKDLSTSITVVDFSNNSLSGDLPRWTEFGSLKEMYLDNNNFNGTLNLTTYFEDLENLQVLSLMNNNISKVVYNNIFFKNITKVIKLQKNPFCEGDVFSSDARRCFCLQLCFKREEFDNSRKVVIIATTSSAACIIGIIIISIILCWKNKRYENLLLLEFQSRFSELDVKPTIFSYNQLRLATNNFDSTMKLGEGGFGVVYKGTLSKGDTIAVKKLNMMVTTKEIDDFLHEVIIINGMKHRNLVSLKGCCLRGEDRLLVYEYVENHDIEQTLLNSEDADISWSMRRNICIGVAHGLHYLHALAQPRIIHRDIKASNILLDNFFAPKIADFGIALFFPEEKTHVTTMHIAGTRGYMAPEYLMHGQLSEKIDVFSFGILCLEVVSGRKHTDSRLPVEQMLLANWAWILFEENRLMELVDRRLHLHFDERLEVQQTINVALLCIQMDPEKRPTMARAVAMLQRDPASEEVTVPIPCREVELPLMRSSRTSTSSSSTENSSFSTRLRNTSNG